jgi:anti-anti-sigma regulatory factor
MKITTNGTWQFPENIELADIHRYTETFSSLQHTGEVIFDLNGTRSIHAAFVGFLIQVKSESEKNGARLRVELSVELRRLFTLLNILRFFSDPASEELTA